VKLILRLSALANRLIWESNLELTDTWMVQCVLPLDCTELVLFGIYHQTIWERSQIYALPTVLSRQYFKIISDTNLLVPPAVPTDPKNAFTFSSMWTDDILTQDQVDYILKTDGACFTGIRMQYFDSYGARYWSDICVTRQANGILAHCNKHNEMH
jgi:hypothetical protein